MKENKSISNTSPSKAPPSDSPPFFQSKLTVNTPGDAYEQEADSMADRVMRMPEGNIPFFAPISNIGSIQRKCATCQDEEKVQRKETANSSGQIAPPEVAQTLSSGTGQALDSSTQQFMGSRFGHDFSQVRIKTDAQAASSAQTIQAKAYTSGTDIVFGSGEYQPSTTEGKRLLAHELTHVVQQGRIPSGVQKKGLIDPFGETDLETLRNRILAPLRRSDATGFSTQIRTLTESESKLIIKDNAFWREIRQVFRGKSLWTVFTIIYFNNEISAAQRRLSMALSLGTIKEATDALAIIIADGEPFITQYWDMLEEVIFTVYKDDPHMIELFRILILRDSEHSKPRDLSFRSSEVHYEKDASGTYNLEYYGSNYGMTAYATRQELRIIVRIAFMDGLKPDQPYSFMKDSERGIHDAWISAITRVWNNKFTISNGGNPLNFTVVPIFVYDNSSANTKVLILGDRSQKCPGTLQAGRANEGCWFSDDQTMASTIAHEFGHLLGASDEYNLPGSKAEVPAAMQAKLSADDLDLTTIEGITGKTKRAKKKGHSIESLMGTSYKSTSVYARHIRLLIKAFNASLPAGTPPYTVKEK